VIQETRTLSEAIPDEVLRVGGILAERKGLPSNVGAFHTHLIEEDLRSMELAVASGDVVEMLRAYNKLQNIVQNIEA
jgi:hypothetical protein